MPKLLIVEEEQMIRQALRLGFEKDGYLVDEAENGQEGLKTVSTFQPDVILLDIMMPVMDGIKFLGNLRLDPFGQKVLVILLTSTTNYHHVAEAMAFGVTDYLQKSEHTVDQVVQVVKEKLFEHQMGGPMV